MDQAGLAVRELSSRTGRDGLLDAAFTRREGRTVLVRRRFQNPLQLMEPVSLGDDPACWIVMLNPSGGVLGGDHLTVELELGAHTHVGITTPSATRVYRSDGARSVLETRARVGPGAVLEYVPDHLIPHAGACVAQSTRVDLAAEARLVLWDAVALGRPARREWWSFESLSTELEVSIEGRPVLVDRVRLGSREPALLGRGGLEGHRYLATLAVVAPHFTEWDRLVSEIAARLGPDSPTPGGASRLASHGCLVRVLADSAYALDDASRTLWALVRRRVLGLREMDLRKA